MNIQNRRRITWLFAIWYKWNNNYWWWLATSSHWI